MISKERIDLEIKRISPYLHDNYRMAWDQGFRNGVRFAEAELQSKPQTFEIDFCGHVKAKVEFNDDKLLIIAVMDGYGDAIDPDQITITQMEQ